MITLGYGIGEAVATPDIAHIEGCVSIYATLAGNVEVYPALSARTRVIPTISGSVETQP